MPVKVGDVSVTTLNEAFKTALTGWLKQHNKAVQRLARFIKKEFETELNKTLKYSGGSYRSPFSNASVRADVIFQLNSTPVNTKFYTFTVKVRVVDDSGQPHKIWHYVNFGTKERVLSKSVNIPITTPRTTPNSLLVKPSSGTQGWFRAKKGKRMGAIEARNWYDVATKNVLKAMRKEKSFAYLGLTNFRLEIRDLFGNVTTLIK